MAIQDDYFDLRAYLEGTDYEHTFERFAGWAFDLDGTTDELIAQNDTLRGAFALVIDPDSSPELRRPPRRDEVEISIPISDPAAIGALGASFVADTGRAGEEILDRFGEKGPLVAVSATRDGAFIRFRLRRP